MLRRIRWLPVLLCLSGCAGTGFNTQSFQDDVAQGRYPQAVSRLDAFGKHDVSALLDRGLLLQAQGRYRESNEVFAQAEQRIEDLYTRSLSKEALSLLTSDRALDYRASGFEHAYIAYYRAWNYLELGQPEDVLVEARVINERLTFREDSCRELGGVCGHDMFLRYFSGLLFEWGGEPNSAYIAYKQAHQAAAGSRERGAAAPADLGLRLVRLARRLGFAEEAEQHAAAFGVADPGTRGDSLEVVVVLENGLIGTRREVGALIPIFTGETRQIAADRETWSRTLAHRRHVSYDKAKLEYLLRISLPEFQHRPPQVRRGEVAGGPAGVPMVRAVSLTTLAAESLEQAMGGITVRAVSRGLVKYLAKQAADKKLGEGGGLLVNILGAGLESADTRSWRSLPGEMHLATARVEPATPAVLVRMWSGRGDLAGEAELPLPPARNGMVLVRHRALP